MKSFRYLVGCLLWSVSLCFAAFGQETNQPVTTGLTGLQASGSVSNRFKAPVKHQPPAQQADLSNSGVADIPALRLLNLKRYDEALAEAKKSLQQNPQDTGALFVLGRAHFQKQDFQGAADTFEKYVVLRTNNANAYLWLSRKQMIAASHSAGGFAVPILLMVLVGAGMIFDTVRQSRIKRQRVSDLRGLATRLEFEDFNPNRDEGFAMGWGFLNRLAQGQERYAFNILRGTYHEQSLFVFDYHYQTGSGKSRKEHYFTMLMLVVKEAFPQLTIGPESLRAKIAAAFGVGDDIKFESAEFSRSFCVRSPEKKFAYDVCNPQMIQYLLANPGLQIEIQGPVLLLAFAPQLPVGQIEFNLQRLIEIRSRLPEYLFTNA